jgi:3-phytase
MERSKSSRPAPSRFLAVVLALGLAACRAPEPAPAPASPNAPPAPAAAAVAAPANAVALVPALTSAKVVHDTDDPAIWIDPRDRSRSLVIGTDKDADGALYAFGLDGSVRKRVGGLRRPNNVDVEYGLPLGGKPTDIAVTTERLGDTIRVYRLPTLEPIDGGPIPVFDGEAQKLPMGVALYKRPRDGAIFAIISRKQGPHQGYVWQYRLEDDGKGRVRATKVRAFGTWSGKAEIEAIAVDDALGYVYYTDEWTGVRKYHADPDAPGADKELALFGTDGFQEDREGISIYAMSDGTGYLIVSDQQANTFHVFPREGLPGNPHAHPRLKVVKVSTVGSDGSDVTSAALPGFPHGLFVAMTEGGVFHFYAWPQFADGDLVKAVDGARPSSAVPPGGAAAAP